MATGDAPVLETTMEMTAVSLEHTELDPASLVLVRLAALIAVRNVAAPEPEEGEQHEQPMVDR